MTQTLNSEAIEALIAGMAENLRARMEVYGYPDPVMVGIHTGGVWVAERLHHLLGLENPLGTLDISFYRDDFTRIGLNPQVRPSHLPFDVEDRHVVLVDDVLSTGRTVRAALNELFDYGRPASVTLAVLVERGRRELPIQADVVGMEMTLERNQHIKLSGPEPLALNIQRVD